MKENIQLQDERVMEERRKIQSRGFSLLIWALLISLLLQMFMQAPFSQYAAEFWLLFGCGAYQMIANVHHGFNIWGGQEKNTGRQLLYTIVAAMVAGLIISFVSPEQSFKELIVFLIVYIPMFYGVRKFLMYASNKRKEKLDRKFDDDDAD